MTKFHNPVNLWAMVREISAGGVVIRRLENAWWTAVIEPRKDDLQKEAVLAATSKPQRVLFALPKGLVDLGESRNKPRCGRFARRPASPRSRLPNSPISNTFTSAVGAITCEFSRS